MRSPWHLIAIEDLREVDFYTGKRIPLSAGAGHVCDRCGLEHAVVYTLQSDDGRTFRVGSTCVNQLTSGWEPSKEELRRAKKEEKLRTEARSNAHLGEIANDIAMHVLTLLPRTPPRVTS